MSALQCNSGRVLMPVPWWARLFGVTMTVLETGHGSTDEHGGEALVVVGTALGSVVAQLEVPASVPLQARRDRSCADSEPTRAHARIAA